MTINCQSKHTSSFAQVGTEPRYAPDIRLSPIHLELHLKFGIESRELSATAKWSILCKTPDSKELILDAIDLDIENIFDGVNELTWWQNNDKIHIRWNTPFIAAEIRVVSIKYSVKNPVAGLYFGGPTSQNKDRGHFVVSDHETERARYWLPCIDHSAVRCPLDVFITHDPDYEALSNGELVSKEPTPDGNSISHWRLKSPCPSYLMCVAVGQFTRFEDGEFEGIPIAAFALKPCSVETLKRCFGPTKSIMAQITKRLGPLPWTKYYQFIAPGIGGAMENISLVSWDDFFEMDATMHKTLGQRMDQINVHEMAHTWFGDLIVCRDYAHVWLKESWATYMEIVWLDDTKGPDEAQYELLMKRRSYFGEVKNRYSRPIMTRTFDSAWSMYDMHLYPGGAVRLHMLRHLLGDDLFWAGTQKYIDQYSGDVVETDDLRRCYEQASGLSLAEFFDQWFCRAGHPHLDVTNSYDIDGKILTLTIKQSLKGANKDAALFKLDIDVAIQDTNGDWTKHTINIKGPQTHFTYFTDEAPLQIIIDPHSVSVASIKFDPGEKFLKNSLSATATPYIHGRILSGETLCQSGRERFINWVENAFSGEPFWGVRHEWANALGTCKTPAAQQAILNLLPHETHPLVQVQLARALGNHCSHFSAHALHEFLQRVDIGYAAREAALIAMGKQRVYVNRDDIMDGLSDNGWYGYVRRGAVRALGQVQTHTAALHLRDIVRSIEELPQVRMAACQALALCSKDLKPVYRNEAVEALCESLQSTHHRLRVSAARSLITLPHPSAVSALESAKGLIEIQSHPIIEKALMACRSYNPTKTDGGLKKRIESLEGELKKIRTHVEKLESHNQALQPPSNKS